MDEYFFIFVYLFFALSFFWIVMNYMWEKKKFFRYYPFILVGFIFSFQSFFVYYGVQESFYWVIVEICYIISLVWIGLNLWRKKCLKE